MNTGLKRDIFVRECKLGALCLQFSHPHVERVSRDNRCVAIVA